MFKKFVQKWDMFCADWGEYLRLCRRCRELGRCLSDKRDAITVSYEFGNAPSQPYCIRDVMVAFSGRPDEFYVSRKNEFVETLCPNYKKDISECMASACPRCVQKREYSNAVAEYNAAIAARRAFWRNRGKSNSK